MTEDRFPSTSGIKQTSINLPNEIWILAKQNLIEFKDALIFGIRFKIAENQGFDYPINSLSTKIGFLAKKIQELTDENESLRNPVPTKTAEEEVEEAFKDVK